ncbi:MAG: 16S rRNA (cytosine(967)-C(5))-methyltransferase RsmB [Methylococcales bacterium]|nr:16S rRNA (cytosine(967)-C(5))-methyltransferase RsmB [Methylococcales bacterium]
MSLRLIATGVLVKVVKDGQSLTVALEKAFESVEDSKDRAFIQALCFGVIRQYHRLDFILQQLLSKPLRNKDTDIKVLLLIGLYQLQYMRVKSHAAVSETVSAAKKKSWAKSLINGVLRQYIRAQESLEEAANKDRLAASSHPEWLVNKLENDWPEQVTALLAENNKQPPMVLRVNLSQTTREVYLQLLVDNEITASVVSFCPTAIVLDQPVAVEKLPRFNDGWVSVQDTAAQLAAQLLDVQAGQSVLDLCAAPGGKTAAILEGQAESISMLAVDIDEGRLTRVNENLQRLKLQAKVIAGDASKPDEWVQGQVFDRILVDAPCSALGVIRRHPDIKILRRETDISTLQTIQQQILNAAWELLAPGGILLYATCSVLKQENELQVESFLKTHKDASEVVIEGEWGVKRGVGRQVLTGDLAMDGFYYAKLIKQ